MWMSEALTIDVQLISDVSIHMLIIQALRYRKIFVIIIIQGFKIFYNRRYFLNFRRYLKN
jgi:hypothetical protein